MKKIKLNGVLGKGKSVLVDDEDYPILIRYRWNLDTDGYAISVGYRYKMHRLIMGVSPSKIIDHVNGIKIDNQKNNLRVVSAWQNCCNSKHKTGSSNYRGVNKANSKKERWEACISSNNKQIHLGTFATPEDAARAYDKKAKELRGIYAVLNFK